MTIFFPPGNNEVERVSSGRFFRQDFFQRVRSFFICSFLSPEEQRQLEKFLADGKPRGQMRFRPGERRRATDAKRFIAGAPLSNFRAAPREITVQERPELERGNLSQDLHFEDCPTIQRIELEPLHGLPVLGS